jgi:hypothetical protein
MDEAIEADTNNDGNDGDIKSWPEGFLGSFLVGFLEGASFI